MSFSLPARASLAALIGLAVALPVAIAAPTKPTPAGKTPPTAVGSSLSAIEESCDKTESDSKTALRKKRYEQVSAYLKANPAAKDVEATRWTAMNLAEEIEEWTKTLEHADDYLANHKEGDHRIDVEFTRAGALGHLKKNDDARKAYDALLGTLTVQKNGIAVWNVGSAYANWLVDIDDLPAATKQWQAMKDTFSGVGGAEQLVGSAESSLKSIEMIGTEPTAFPETAKDLDGKPLSLADYKGKVLLIDFWATWCGPCVKEMPNVIKQYEKYHAKGFEIVGISLDKKDEDEKVKTFTKQHGMPWRQFYDGGWWQNEIAVLYEVKSIPRTILVGKDGKVIKSGLHGEGLAKALAKVFDAK